MVRSRPQFRLGRKMMKPFQTWRCFARFVSGGKDMNVRLAFWFLAWLSLLSVTLQLALPRALAADTDGDGLLDLIDVPRVRSECGGHISIFRLARHPRPRRS